MLWIFIWDETQIILLQTNHTLHCHLDEITLHLQFSLFSFVDHHPLIDYWLITSQGGLRHRSNEQNAGLWHRYSPSNGHLSSWCKAKKRMLRWQLPQGRLFVKFFYCYREWNRVVGFYFIRNRWYDCLFIQGNTEGHEY